MEDAQRAAARHTAGGKEKKKEEDESEDEDEATEPLRIGAFITLRNVPTGAARKRGFLGAEGVLDDNCVVSEVPGRFDECVFQICIQNQYSALKEYEENIQYLEELHGEQDDADDVDDEDESDAAKLTKLVDSLKRSMDNEKSLNDTYMGQSIGTAIMFGSVIQLLHVKSRKYLTVEPNQVANQERENLRVHLSEFGSSLSWFTLLPCYKIDREGDPVNSGSSVILRITERTAEQIHCCEMPTRLSDPDRPTREVNCSLETTGWKAATYSSYHDESDAAFYCGDIVRLVDPELNAQLRLVGGEATSNRCDCVLTPPGDDPARNDSSALWVIEGFYRPATGGPVTFGDARSFRLRHLNSGRYLAVRSTDLWRKSARLAVAMRSLSGAAKAEDVRPSTAEERKADYRYCALYGGLTPSCALTLTSPSAGYKKNAGSPGGAPPITNGSPVQISCQGRWMQVGPAAGDGIDMHVLGHASRGACLSLLFERFEPSGDVGNDILVGVAAFPRLTSFLGCLEKAADMGFKDLLQVAEPAFVDTLDQLADFLQGKPLTEDPGYETLVPSELRDLDAARQMLLQEQGVLKVLVDVLKKLDVLVERAALSQTGGTSSSLQRKSNAGAHPHKPARRKSLAGLGKARRKSSVVTHHGRNDLEEMERLQGVVGMRIFWILLLSTRGNAIIQMAVADHMQVILAYVPNEPVAIACLVHMLSTNLPLQETKVSEEETAFVVKMVQESRMSSLYLDLLRALCSCSGRGVDCNQCRVAELWLQDATDLHVAVRPDGASAAEATWTLESGEGFSLPEPDLVKHVRGHELLNKPLPALYLSWETNHADLTPGRISGGSATACDRVPIDFVFGDDGDPRRDTIAKYFMAQLYLAAELCLDRNYLSIGIIADQFPFPTCLAMIQDAALPNELKAAVVRVVSTVFVDTDPAVKSICPHLAHTWATLSDADGSRPKMPDEHRVYYVLLQDIIDQYLHQAGDPSWDTMRQRMMELLLKLVQFSFYSTAAEMQRLVQPLIGALSKVQDEDRAWGPKQDTAAMAKKAAARERALARSPERPSTSPEKSPRAGTPSEKYKMAAVSPEDEFGDAPPPRARRPWCPCLRARLLPSSWQFRNYAAMNTIKAVLVVLAIVCAMLVFFFIGVDDIQFRGWYSPAARRKQRGDSDENVATPLTAVATACTVSLIVEVTLRWYCHLYTHDGPALKFLWERDNFPFNIIDFLLAAMDVATLTIDFEGIPALKGAKALRMIKLVRIARAAKAISKLAGPAEEEALPDWEMPPRYRFTPQQQIQTMLEIVTVLGEVSLVHREYNLSALLAAFKTSFVADAVDAPALYADVINGAPRLASLATSVLAPGAPDANPSNHGPGDAEVFAAASARFDKIFLDLCLYENDNLVQSALNLLMVQHTVRDCLLRDVTATQLLCHPDEERQCKRLGGILAELQSNAERHEIWGDIEDDEEQRINERVKTILRELASVCMQRRTVPGRDAYEPVPLVQTLLYNLGALDVAITVIGLEASMNDGVEEHVCENTKDIIRLCMIFLQWFVRDNRQNQLAAYEHIDVFVDCFEHEVLAPCVIAECVRGNVHLCKNFPMRIVTECVSQLIKRGRNVHYLMLFEALLFLSEGDVENNVELQFGVLRELSRPTTNEPIMWLCQEPGSLDYAERTELMAEGSRLLDEAAASRMPPPFMTPAMDEEYTMPLLRYHTKLLEVLAGCALGSVNITTVEAKLQNMYKPKQLLTAILDHRSTLDVRFALSTFLYHTVVEVEIAVPDYERNVDAWRFMETFPAVFADATDAFRKPLAHGLCADGAVGVRARLQLAQAHLCAMYLTVFMERYLPGPLSWREVEIDPGLVKAHGGEPVDPLAGSGDDGSGGSGDDSPRAPRSWLKHVMVDIFVSLNELFEVDAENMPYDRREAFHSALVRLSLSLRGERYAVGPLDAPAPRGSGDDGAAAAEDASTPSGAFAAFVRELGGVVDEGDSDHRRIVESFGSIPKLADNETGSEIRLEPLLEKLVDHTLSRMVPTVRGKKLDAECTRTTRWLVTVFRAMIEDRWGMTIDERDDDGGEEEDDAAYDLQLMLNRCGVTRLCLSLIAPGIERELTIEAIKLCIALLFREGGNTAVQETIHEVLSGEAELFFKAVRDAMVEIKNYYLYGDPPLVDDEEADVEIPGSCMMMRFLQLMSEGHFEPNQDIMREQPQTNINLLDDFVELLSILSRDKNRCRSSTKAALQAAATVLEVIQGPCKKNQMHLAIHTELIEILNRITRSKPIRDCLADEDNEVKKTALEIFEGLLEGETGASVIITRIISVIDLDVLRGIIEAQEAGDEENADLTEIQMESLVLLQMFFDFKPALRDQCQLSPRVQKLMGKRVTSVEVVWDGTILRRFFPVPAICDHIAEATRQKLVTEVDRSSDEARLQDFMKRAQDIYREIKHQQVLQEITIGQFNLSTIFSRRNQEYATWLAFCVAVTINSIMMAYASHSRTDDPENPRSFKTKQSDRMWTGDNDMIYDYVLTPLNGFNIGLSSFTLTLFIVVRCPVKYQKFVEDGYSLLAALGSTMLDPMTLYYFVYTMLAALGLKYRICSAVLLLDIVVKDPTSGDVINAVVYPRRQLGATALLGFFVVYIFALLIFQAYADGFSYADDGSGGFPEDCRSLLRCMSVTMMYGLRLSGGIGDIMKHTWSTRLWIDFLYFLIVLIVLLNVIFGIIIDTFSDLRGQKGDRLFKTVHSCFICGVDDMTFDRASDVAGGFRRHIKEDHAMWDYLHFIVFIWEQDKDEDDGLELYVRNAIEATDMTWLPVGRAICLDDTINEEQSVSDQIAALRATLDDLMRSNETAVTTSVERSAENLRKSMLASAAKLGKRMDSVDAMLLTKADGLASAPATGRSAPGGVRATRSVQKSVDRPIDRRSPGPKRGRSPTSPALRSSAPLDGSCDILTVEIHGAADLVEVHLLGSGDPYVFARCSTDAGVFGETERIWMTQTPKWPKKTSVLRCAAPVVGESVSIELWHCHRRGQGYFLGEATVEIDPTTVDGRQTVDLKRKPGAKAQTFVQGTLDATFTLTFATK